MKVFISWSGHQSQIVAEALRDWLPMVFQAVSPWLSSSDIYPGSRWARDLESALDKTDFGILCLTRENLFAPWILFEAGALSKSVDIARVVPYLLDLDPTALPGPLSQFQAVRADESGTRRMLYGIANANQVNVRPDEFLKRVFERWWPDLRDQLDKARHTAEDLQRARLNVHASPSEDYTRTLTDIIHSLENFHSNPEGIYYIGQTLVRCSSFFADHGGSPRASELVSKLITEIDTDERKEMGALDPIVSVAKVNELIGILKRLRKEVGREDT